MKKAGNLTSEQVQEILELYPDMPTAEIAKMYGKPVYDISTGEELSECPMQKECELFKNEII